MLSTVWTTEKRRGRKETEVARRIKGESKGERQIQAIISSLSVLHHLGHTKRFTEWGREEKGEGGDRGDLGGKVKSESEVIHSCPTLCDPMDCSLPGFSIHGIFQARVLEWVAISFSRGSSQPRDQTLVSCFGRLVLYN